MCCLRPIWPTDCRLAGEAGILDAVPTERGGAIPPHWVLQATAGTGVKAGALTHPPSIGNERGETLLDKVVIVRQGLLNPLFLHHIHGHAVGQRVALIEPLFVSPEGPEE